MIRCRFFRSNRPGYPHPVSSELENSGIRVAVVDCSVTERRRLRPPYRTGKSVHMHAKHYNHNEDGRTAPGVCGNGSVPLSHSGNVVTRIGTHTHTDFIYMDGRTAPGVCGNGSVPLSHSGNVVTRIGTHTHRFYILQRNSDSTHLDAVLKLKRHVATQPRGRPRCADGVALSRVVVPDRKSLYCCC